MLELPCCAGSSKARSNYEKITVAVCFDSFGIGGLCVLNKLMLKFPRIDKIFSAFRSKPWCFWKPKSCLFHKKIGLPLYGSQLAFGAKKIDLICLDESTLVYIEVQLRPQGVCISGIRSINTNKKRFYFAPLRPIYIA